jgi:ribosomal protein S18 acetylase RimI-like enzyme
MNTIDFRQGFAEAQRDQVAHIYCAAFERKITPVYGSLEIARRLIGTELNPTCCFVASDENGDVLGVAGFQHARQRFVNLSARGLMREYGALKGGMRYLVAAFFERTPDKHLLQMDGIAVHEHARGLGIGTRLLEALMEFAQAHCYSGIRLDVVDSNPAAQRLYERMGFASIHTIAYPFLKSFGFSAVTTMVKRLGSV